MRALHINTNRDLGGGERQVLALVEGSRARGVDARLMARAGGALFAAAQERRLAPRSLKLFFSYDPFAIREIANYLKTEKIDILHLHDGAAASVGVAAARASKVPAVVHRRIASPPRKTLFTKLKYNEKRVARFIVVSEVVKNVLIDFSIPSEKISIVPSGLDLEQIDKIIKTPPAGVRELGTIGKLAPKKGIDVVLRAFARIVTKIPEARLTIVGDGPDREILISLARSLNIQNSVAFAGARQDGAAILANWNLLLFASELEGSPGVLREAMALRVPIVSVDAPGSVEVLGGTGIVVSRGDDAALADAAVELLNNTKKRGELTAAARERVVQHFSIGAMVEGTLAVARAVLER